MTLLESRPVLDDVTYGLSDADQHYYEAEDAVTPLAQGPQDGSSLG